MTTTVNTDPAARGIQSYFAAAQSQFQTARQAAATYLGLSAADLSAQLGQGHSLADIATAEGKGVDGLKSAILDAVQKTNAPSGVDLASLVDRIVNAKPGQHGAGHAHHGGRHHGGGFEAVQQSAADYVGVSTDDLQKLLDSGQSLADVAQAQGKTVDGLKSALVGALQGSQSGNATSFLQSLVDSLVTAQGGPLQQGVSVHA